MHHELPKSFHLLVILAALRLVVVIAQKSILSLVLENGISKVLYLMALCHDLVGNINADFRHFRRMPKPYSIHSTGYMQPT